jgi:hypothetical protein
MTKPNDWLNQCAKNITSQHGEDGLIEEILKVIDDKDRWCVEFGAWDGKFLSNTYNIISNNSYSAVLIEADHERIQELKQNFAKNEKVIPVNAFVGWGGEDNLDVILQATPVPANFDLLSIDIDGNEYHVWEAMKQYTPKIVIIEFNMTIPNEAEYIQPRDINIAHGSSPLSITKLANSKGYKLVAATLTNLIFIQGKYFPLLEIENNSLEQIRLDKRSVTYIFNGMDGTVIIRGSGSVGWWPIKYNEKKMQVLPKRLRKPYEYHNRFMKFIVTAYIHLFHRNIVRGMIRRITSAIRPS